MEFKKAHFIGIGGVGMSATAKLLKDAGVDVTGSDEAVYPPISHVLEHAGLPCRTPYKASNIPKDADLIVIGKNAKLVPETNEEVAAAIKSGVRIASFPEVLAEVSADKKNIVVAGSYGKSTSSALIAHCLEQAGKDPSYVIGAVPLSPQTPSRVGKGELFVLEGDEYPSSNTDPRSKFLHLRPQFLLLTPLAHDHFNIFPTPEEYLKPFYELMTLPPEGAHIAVSVDGSLSKEFLAHIKRPVTTYGLTEGDFSAQNIVWGERTHFTLVQHGTELLQLETLQLGKHNIENIVGAAALLLPSNLLTPEEFAAGVASFKGVLRRLDRKSEKTSVPIYEGFGSSYDKLKSAIAAMRIHFPTKRLTVVFEPHTIGWRSRATLSQYDDVFTGASRVIVFNPPHDGKATELTVDDIVSRVAATGVVATGAQHSEDVLKLLEQELSSEDAILISSSGAMGGLIESIPKLAEELFPL